MRKKILSSLIAASFLLVAGVAQAQSTSFISVPAAAFTDLRFHGPGYSGNLSGTTRTFKTEMMAPVNLPHGATIVSLRCGGSSFFRNSVIFTLRRNEPQQENVDVATVRTSLEGGVGRVFEIVNTTSITSGVVNNSRFNYYIMADVTDPGETDVTAAICPNGCSVNFCSIGYKDSPPQGPVISGQ